MFSWWEKERQRRRRRRRQTRGRVNMSDASLCWRKIVYAWLWLRFWWEKLLLDTRMTGDESERCNRLHLIDNRWKPDARRQRVYFFLLLLLLVGCNVTDIDAFSRTRFKCLLSCDAGVNVREEREKEEEKEATESERCHSTYVLSRMVKFIRFHVSIITWDFSSSSLGRRRSCKVKCVARWWTITLHWAYVSHASLGVILPWALESECKLMSCDKWMKEEEEEEEISDMEWFHLRASCVPWFDGNQWFACLLTRLGAEMNHLQTQVVNIVSTTM